ncbi:MAG: hypothetical protein WCG27_10875 [Pseudomonadota bacterium]
MRTKKNATTDDNLSCSSVWPTFQLSGWWDCCLLSGGPNCFWAIGRHQIIQILSGCRLIGITNFQKDYYHRFSVRPNSGNYPTNHA